MNDNAELLSPSVADGSHRAVGWLLCLWYSVCMHIILSSTCVYMSMWYVGCVFVLEKNMYVLSPSYVVVVWYVAALCCMLALAACTALQCKPPWQQHMMHAGHRARTHGHPGARVAAAIAARPGLIQCD
jgi:hypothetical protein